MQNTDHNNEIFVLSLYVQYHLNGPIVKNNGNSVKLFEQQSLLYCSSILHTCADYFVKLKTWLQ